LKAELEAKIDAFKAVTAGQKQLSARKKGGGFP
jgi:hypothetical protein